MIEAEKRVWEFLQFWDEYAQEFLADFEAVREGDDRVADVLVAEYQNGTHKLLASDLKAVLIDLDHWRNRAFQFLTQEE